MSYLLMCEKTAGRVGKNRTCQSRRMHAFSLKMRKCIVSRYADMFGCSQEGVRLCRLGNVASVLWAPSPAFRLDNIERRQVRHNGRGKSSAQDLRLPESLVEIVSQHQDAGNEIECLWSDSQCWPDSQKHLALNVDDFPFVERRDSVTVR